jgi:hypothetical protein
LYRRQAIGEPGRWAEELSAQSGHAEAALARYTHFEFGYSPCAEAAFLSECEQYHELGGSSGLDNERHLAPLEGAACTCPAHVHHDG